MRSTVTAFRKRRMNHRATDRHPNRRRLCERGASLVEYVLLITLIVLVCLGAITTLGAATSTSFTNSSNSLLTAGP